MKMFKLASKITGILTAAAMLCGSTLVVSAAENNSTMLFRSLGYTEAEISAINEASVPNPCYIVYLRADSGANISGSVTSTMSFDSNYFSYAGTAESTYATSTPIVSLSAINPSGWYSNTTSCNIETGMSSVVLYRTKLTAVASKRDEIAAMYTGDAETNISSIYSKHTVTLAYNNGQPIESNYYNTYFTGNRILAVGDVDMDGQIDSGDTTKISDYIAGTGSLNTTEFIAADVNFDYAIDIADLVKTSRVMSGDLSTFW